MRNDPESIPPECILDLILPGVRLGPMGGMGGSPVWALFAVKTVKDNNSLFMRACGAFYCAAVRSRMRNAECDMVEINSKEINTNGDDVDRGTHANGLMLNYYTAGTLLGLSIFNTPGFICKFCIFFFAAQRVWSHMCTLSNVSNILMFFHMKM